MSWSEEEKKAVMMGRPSIGRSDPIVTRMLQNYARKAAQEAMASASAEDGVCLQGVLGSAKGFGYLYFNVSKERHYIVRDVRQLITAIRDNQPVSYGKQLSFVHSINAFSEESRRLADFLVTYSEMLSSSYEWKYLPANMVKRGLFLTPLLMDRFADHCFKEADSRVTVDIDGKVFEAKVYKESPQLKVTVKKRRDFGYSIFLNTPISFIKGSRQIYVIAEESLYICPPDYSRSMRDFFDAILSAPEGELMVAAQDMPAVCASLMSVLRRYTEVEELCDLSEFNPPPLKTSFYLDLDEDGRVCGRMEFDYGGRIHGAFCPKHASRALDIRSEGQMEFLVRPFFSQVSNQGILMLSVENEEKLYGLVTKGLPLFSRYMEVYASESILKMKAKSQSTASVGVGVKLESGLLRLSFQLGELDMSELKGLLESYRLAKRYHRLKDGSFVDLEGEGLGDLSRLMDGLGLSEGDVAMGEVTLPEYRALYLDTLLKESSALTYDRNRRFKELVRDIKNVEDGDFPIPEGLKDVLRGYQKTGYYWMRTLAAHGLGGILADDMGLGKTLQVIALLCSGHVDGAGNKELSLVVCPSSLVLNWEHEIKRFAPELRVAAIYGSTEQRIAVLDENGSGEPLDIMVTSYDLLKRDIRQYAAKKFKYLIADEAQYMKNQHTQNAKAVKVLKARHRFALTGTPIENTLAELWSIFDFLMPGYLYTYNRFRRDFESPIIRQKSLSQEPLGTLHKMVAPFMLRRMKKEVLKELPEKTETILSVPLEGEQEKLYKANLAILKQQLADSSWDVSEQRFEILAAITRLRQLCCHPALVYENYAEYSAKLELCMELVENAISSGHRILIFSQFTSMLEILEKNLREKEVNCLSLTGQTPSPTRLELVNRFNEGTIPVFLISLKAGGTGLNLTGADMVIHFDPWWNVSAENQASDRAYRMGQSRNVQIYKLIAADTIEERIVGMQAQKADLAEMVVEKTDNPLPKLTAEELKKLFAI